MELLGETWSISRQELFAAKECSFEFIFCWFELELFVWLDSNLSVMLEEILLKLAANLSMRKVSLILGLSQLFDLKRCGGCGGCS